MSPGNPWERLLLHEFPERAKLASWSIQFWRRAQAGGEGRAVGTGLCLLLSRFLAKV